MIIKLTNRIGKNLTPNKTIDDVAERFDETTKDFLQNDVLKNSEAEELATLMSRDKGEILKALRRGIYLKRDYFKNEKINKKEDRKSVV